MSRDFSTNRLSCSPFVFSPFFLSRGRKKKIGKLEEGGERGSGSGVGRDKRAKLLGPARLEICKSYVIRLDIRSVHDARIGKFDTERERGVGCVESGPGPLFEPTSALFRDVINGLCSYNLALLRGLFTDTTRSLPLYLSRHSPERIERGIPIVPQETSFLPFLLSFPPFRRAPFVALKGYRGAFSTASTRVFIYFTVCSLVKFSPSLVQACTEKAITISNYGLLNFVHPCLRECSYLIIIRVINSIVGLRLGVK